MSWIPSLGTILLAPIGYLIVRIFYPSAFSTDEDESNEKKAKTKKEG